MKQKTHSGTKKRVKLTGKGKVFFAKAAKNHLISSKSKRQMKFGRLGVQASKGMAKVMKKLLNI